MKNNMEKKILLSKTLEDIEVNRDSSKVISMLDKYHANARSQCFRYNWSTRGW